MIDKHLVSQRQMKEIDWNLENIWNFSLGGEGAEW